MIIRLTGIDGDKCEIDTKEVKLVGSYDAPELRITPTKGGLYYSTPLAFVKEMSIKEK